MNLFGIVTIVAEFLPGGGIFPYWRIDPVRLLRHHDKAGGFILFCEIVFCFYLIYFIYKEAKMMYKLRRNYFKSYWSLAEWTIIITGKSILYNVNRSFIPRLQVQRNSMAVVYE